MRTWLSTLSTLAFASNLIDYLNWACFYYYVTFVVDYSSSFDSVLRSASEFDGSVVPDPDQAAVAAASSLHFSFH